MKYALVCNRVWEVLGIDKLNNEALIARSNQKASIALEKLEFISPITEAEKIVQQCQPYLSEMESFGDIDHLKNIDGNELLPFTECFSVLDQELVGFLNETIRLVDHHIQSCP